MMRAKALVAFPGGFGTLTSCLKCSPWCRPASPPVPIILFGTQFWKRLINFEFLVEEGTISAENLDLFHYTDDPQEAWELIRAFYQPEARRGLACRAHQGLEAARVPVVGCPGSRARPASPARQAGGT